MRGIAVTLACISALAAGANDVDPRHPVETDGSVVRYDGTETSLGERCLLVDGSLSDEEAASSPWVYNDFSEAMRHLTDGTETCPMRVLIAPWVYWIDDPDDESVRVGKDGREPIGLSVRCEHLHLTGLTTDARNVVLAAARGQTQGAVGNFTMIEFWGDGLEVRNLTMGNYCNVDLEYPLKPEMGRPRRMSAITQAHVAYAHGDRIYAENVRFVSRLNMNPLSGGRRTLFVDCHMEMTDDALAASGVYLRCELDYYGARPFWGTHPNGAVLLDCDINMRNSNSEVFFCKGVGQVSAVDCRIHSDHPLYFGWTKYPPQWLRCYEYRTSLDGESYSIGGDTPLNTVDLGGLPLLQAYAVDTGEGTVYNTYNLLRGDDDWDPMDVKRLCGSHADIATSLTVTPREATATTGGGDCVLLAQAYRHCGYPIEGEVSWSIVAGDPAMAELTARGAECTVRGANHTDEAHTIVVQATAPTGLQGAAVVTVRPQAMPAPEFAEAPAASIRGGEATVSYALALDGSRDCTDITWLRVTGSDTVAVAVSRGGSPKTAYRLQPADLGHTLIAAVRPRCARSDYGDTRLATVRVPSGTAIEPSEYMVDTDFSDFPTSVQPRVIAGAWTVDCHKPADTAPYDWTPDPTAPAWAYGTGFNGARGEGLLQVQRGARLLYTPLDGEYGDMELWLDVDPTKTGGQGFGSATGQYMDVCIKFDTRTLTGYALRIERTTKHSNAVDFSLVSYRHGEETALTAPVSAVCYRTGCHIHLAATGGRLSARVHTDTPVAAPDPSLSTSVSLEAEISPTPYGGIGIQHTGTCGENTTMLHHLRAKAQKAR